MDEYEKAFCPQNTKVNTRWAVNKFNAWQCDYNTRHPEKPCPDDLLLSDSASDVASWLEKYVLSTRKRNGEPYPPKTVYVPFIVWATALHEGGESVCYEHF